MWLRWAALERGPKYVRPHSVANGHLDRERARLVWFHGGTELWGTERERECDSDADVPTVAGVGTHPRRVCAGAGSSR